MSSINSMITLSNACSRYLVIPGLSFCFPVNCPNDSFRHKSSNTSSFIKGSLLLHFSRGKNTYDCKRKQKSSPTSFWEVCC